MPNSTDSTHLTPSDSERQRQLRQQRMARYRAHWPQRRVVQRLRDARSLLRRYGFDVSGGDVDLNNLHALDDVQPDRQDDEGGGSDE